MIDQIINSIYQWMAWLGNRIVNALIAMFDKLWSWVIDTVAVIVEFINNLFTSVWTWLEEMLAGVTEYFNAILDGIAEAIDGIWSQFEELTTAVIDHIVEWLNDAFSEISAFVGTLVDEVESWLKTAAGSVVKLINEGIEAVIGVASKVKETLLGWIDVVLQKIVEAYEASVAKLNLALDSFFGGLGSFIDSIEARLSQLKEAFAEAATKVVGGMTEAAEEYLLPIRDRFKELLDGLIPEGDTQRAEDFVKEVGKLQAGKTTAEEYHKFASEYWMEGKPFGGFWAHAFMTLIGWLGGAALIWQLVSISSQVMMQDYAKMWPYQLFTPGDATQAWRRGLLTTDKAVDAIQRQGWTEENANIILKLSDQVPQVGDLMVLLHRGLIGEKDFDDALHQLGYDTFYRERMKAASFLIPPITDLITMAVREAFSPAVAERFGQYEDYPDDLTEWAEKQALSPEWARRYWAAHWALPSPNQGFEMLHRGVIQEEDLTLLLRALDVMPFWRDRLTKIAYTPFTRIDIRRMHKVGVLSEADVLSSYRDLGYDAKKARVMTDFVMLLNAPPAADDEEDLKELSRSNVVNFYSDGLIPKPKALELLGTMGYTPDAATLYLDSADLDEQRKERKDEVALILSLAKAGVIDFQTAEDRLSRSGLETAEINKAIISLVRERQKRTKLPSRGEAERMTKAGLIKGDDYKELLEIMGYSEKWVNGYIGLLEAKG